MNDKAWTEQDMEAALAALPAERRDELEAIGRRAAIAVDQLLREARDRDEVAEALREPWEIASKLGIPRERLSEESEEQLRVAFLDLVQAPKGIFDCIKCKAIVFATVLGFVVATAIITAVLAPEIAVAIIGALVAGGIAVAVGAAALALIFVGMIASTIGDPVCSFVGAC